MINNSARRNRYFFVMRWKKHNLNDVKKIFDVETPDVDLSLDSVFNELKSELKEERSRKIKKRKKRGPPKAKRRKKPSEVTVNISEQVVDTLVDGLVDDLVGELITPPPKPEEVIEVKNKTEVDLALESISILEEPEVKDPIALENTPKYMTQEEFQKHYRTFLDRIQIQLDSLGGGGAVNIRDMDDVDTSFITDPAPLDGAMMRMRYLPDQKILQFYGDTNITGFGGTTYIETTSGVLDILGTDSQINLTSVGGTFTASFSDTIVAPGTFNSVGMTTLSSGGEDTETGGNLRVSGVTNSTRFSTTSDERLKDNIKKIPNPLETIVGIEGVTFNWKSDGTPDVGLIAQDVERCLPDAVMENDGVKSVNYNGVIGLLVEAVKELSMDNQLMKMEIDKLKGL